MPDFVKSELFYLTPRLFLCGTLAFVISGLVWKWDLSFALGLVFGIICVLANFVIIGIVSYRASMRGAKSAVLIMRISYFVRIIALGGCLYICYIIPWLNPIAFFVTPFFINVTYFSKSILDTIKERHSKQ
jgi:hypothetical protein